MNAPDRAVTGVTVVEFSAARTAAGRAWTIELSLEAGAL